MSSAAHARGAARAPEEARPSVEVHPVRGRADLTAFIRLPWRIYADDPAWVPPLIHDVRKVLDPARHPFHEHAEVALFLARRDGEVAGRIAAVVNRQHVDFHEESAGFFGLFESIDDPEVSGALLEATERWLVERGMRIARGPFNLSTNDELYSGGVLIDGFGFPPLVLMAHTPPYYAALLERAGYGKAKDLLAYWHSGEQPADRLVRVGERILQREGVTIRPIDLGRFEEEVALVQEIYNSAWERNWGFVPMTETEILHLAKELRPVVNPRFCVIAEVAGEAVGFGLALPDYNQA
ncbi:MAG: N-acetyltransferase, partial [Longimicrobiales bacterium]